MSVLPGESVHDARASNLVPDLNLSALRGYAIIVIIYLLQDEKASYETYNTNLKASG